MDLFPGVFPTTYPQLAYDAGAIDFLFENVGTGNDELFYEAVTPGTRIDQLGDVLEEGRV